MSRYWNADYNQGVEYIDRQVAARKQPQRWIKAEYARCTRRALASTSGFTTGCVTRLLDYADKLGVAL